MLSTLIAAVLFSAAVDDAPAVPPSEFTEAGHTKDDLKVVKERVKKKQAILLDVREQPEWADGHLEHAKSLPMSVVRSGKLTKEQQKLLPKGKPIYLHCLGGSRVLAVSKMLKGKGYDIRPLKAGYPVLLKSGFEKAKPKPPSLTTPGK